jgi:ABC-type transport system involved in cytochrome c biogenesis ATPase subunit
MALSAEFARFKEWLRQQQPTEAVLKICAVVEQNLGDIARTTHAGGQRTRLITPMIRQGMGQPLPQGAEHQAAEDGVAWDRLVRLELGPFRGFRRQETFELDHGTVLVLGANGTGKSSLCEALELALLGRIEEAEERGLETRHYLDNAHERSHTHPVLIGRVNGKERELTPDEEQHRFIIVERNRIESFARIGARRPAEANSMLAALFGLTAFNDFITGFGNSLDSQLKLALPKAADLERRRAAMAADQAKVVSEAENHAGLNRQRAEVADRFEPGLDYPGLKARIGTAEAPGRLHEIRAILANPLPAPSGVRAAVLIGHRRRTRQLTQALAQARAALAARAQDVSYRGLYRAVSALEGVSPDRCPACETPLGLVAANPFARAAQGLLVLQELAELEGQAVRLERDLERQHGALEAALRTAVGHARQLQDPQAPALAFDQPLANYDRTDWRAVLGAARTLERRDQGLAVQQAARDALSAEGEKLQAARAQLAAIEGRQRQFDEDVAAARARLQAFEQETAVLVAEVAAEAAGHVTEVLIRDSYEVFLALLRRYNASLPALLMADLNDVTVDLYNRFNVHDQAADLIHELRLPLRGGEPLEVRFKGEPERWHNALAILSEGHLRCLGLALLLAKNIKLELPTVLLDDAVNAIDHEHREGIRTTLFGHPDLKDKQLIVTCHSPEFIKDIHTNHVKDAPLYVLRHHDGDHHPIVSGGKTRNYIERAEGHIADFDARAALSCSRQALENLVIRMWKKLATDFPQLGTLSLPLRRPESPPDLSNIAQSLGSALNQGIKAGILADPWTTRRDHLEALLKAKENSLAWMSLNKGTHEEQDRDDFEEPTLRRIVEALRGLEGTFKG